MEKIISILLFFCFFFSLPAFSRNNYYLGENYKKEMTKTIDREYPKAMKAIDNVFDEFEKEQNSYKKQAIADWGISSVMFYFFNELIKQTNKYVIQSLPKLETDWNYALEKQIMPYLKKNKVDMSKIKLLRKYADKKQHEIEKKYDEVIYAMP